MLAQQDVVILDGGLATELEKRGYDLGHRLWSARLLIEAPAAIRAIHDSYLEAGADCIATATYQATIPGFVSEGLTTAEAEALLRKAVSLALEARDAFFADVGRTRLRPLVAASIGPYGAFLADGSEYRGNYGISKAELRAFHLSRWQVLADSSADLFACETIPSIEEAEVLRELIDRSLAVEAWISFSCCDSMHLCDGTPVKEAAALFARSERTVAVGVNCTAPRHVLSLIEQIRMGAPDKPVIVYPNSGERFDASNKRWFGEADAEDFANYALEWRKRGAQLIGGCCRTGPEHIRRIRDALQI